MIFVGFPDHNPKNVQAHGSLNAVPTLNPIIIIS